MSEKKCPKCDCGMAMIKTAYMDAEGWILQWECSFLGCDYIDPFGWPYEEPKTSKELEELGYEIV